MRQCHLAVRPLPPHVLWTQKQQKKWNIVIIIISTIHCQHPSSHHLSCDDCLEDKSEHYQNCSVLYCVPKLYTVISTHIWAVLTAVLRTEFRRLLWGFFVYFCYLRPVCLHTYIHKWIYNAQPSQAKLESVCFGVYFVFLVYFSICAELSLPVQVIAWKDSSLKLPIMYRAGHKTLLTQSLIASTSDMEFHKHFNCYQ